MLPPSLDQADEASIHPIDVVREILSRVGGLPRLMELSYLVQEPGVLDIVRALASLCDEDRDKLHAFLTANSDCALRLRETARGSIVLESGGPP